MTTMGLTFKCVQHNSIQLKKIINSRNILLPYLNQSHLKFSSLICDRTKEYIRVIPQGHIEFTSKRSRSENSELLKPHFCLTCSNVLQPDRALSNKCKVKSEYKTEQLGEDEDSSTLTGKERFKKAMKAYGPVVIIFHLTLSWGSLAFLYLLISKYV